MFNKSSLINQVPTDLIVGTSTVAENEAIGKVVGTFKTTDPDLANTFIYSLVAGTGSTDNASFTIVGNQLKTNAVFDFETKNSYSVRVRTTDQGGLFYEKQLNIGINNTNELANLSQYANSVIGFSSQYTTTSWSASQALGAPNTFAYGDITTAWAPVLQNGASEFFTLGFNTPVYATGVTIRETYGNGVVSKIET
ncbi:cadherin repeat domain-containing protein, partial [Dolichospermum sp. ST_sed9]|nr:cadherin repeat domain-containing protein [Dolichospermum sp. ST_sed9]